ncbi:hypothetical protein ACJIZ3_005439 [Penstemon smallii]|uniref:Uncharacterized protein n=1 Tax=Penstemon smallii TaxID=265156 RepID=A0ABD3S4V9_9LAMI
MLLSESWQQNRMGDSIKHKVCTGLGAQRVKGDKLNHYNGLSSFTYVPTLRMKSFCFIVAISYCVYFLSSALGGEVLFSNEN